MVIVIEVMLRWIMNCIRRRNRNIVVCCVWEIWWCFGFLFCVGVVVMIEVVVDLSMIMEFWLENGFVWFDGDFLFIVVDLFVCYFDGWNMVFEM